MQIKRTRKCAICRASFQPKSMTHKLCGSADCGIEWAEKERTKRERKESRIKARQEAEDRKQTKERINQLKPLTYWEKRAEQQFNRYVRLRDLYAGHGCISCEKPNNWHGQWHASHFKSVGANSFLRYHLWNVHMACSVCNDRLSGNIGEYTLRLPSRIGQERFQYVETAPRVKRYDREYLDRLWRVFKKKADRIQARLDNR